jgi:hypothetical protein
MASTKEEITAANNKKSIKRHRIIITTSTKLNKFNKLLFFSKMFARIEASKKNMKFVCIFVLYFDKHIYLFIFYEALTTTTTTTLSLFSNPSRSRIVILFWFASKSELFFSYEK